MIFLKSTSVQSVVLPTKGKCKLKMQNKNKSDLNQGFLFANFNGDYIQHSKHPWLELIPHVAVLASSIYGGLLQCFFIY